mmetsp:Transcript_6847/g.10159  ORF Transcript_6847/g.10159 Transcript_6847/m.10159 type:complete len:208 (-) Transcript_6847:2101-2724(-)
MNDDGKSNARRGHLKLQMVSRKMSERLRDEMRLLVDSKNIQATEEERNLLKQWRSKTCFHSGIAAFAGYALMRLPPWPASKSISIIMSVTSAFMIGTWSCVNQAPDIIIKMIHQPISSRLVDDAICPSLGELDSCLNEPDCAAALHTTTKSAFRTSNNEAIDIISILQQCRERKNSFKHRDNYSSTEMSLNEWGFPEQPSDNARDDE